ncbi:MAG: penicillin acylase family protein [Chloroherpetonaceae bacterium]|nr:penicillin acylase family protein [Chloroherpetonaceae bacterium]
MTLVRMLLWVVLSGALAYVLYRPIGTIPAVGSFFNPFGGFWTNHRGLDSLPTRLELPQLIAPVEVLWDSRHVPHIFAHNLHDLYFAQGYLTARHRLWQMDFQARAALGRIAEVVGERALEFDRFRRRIGMPELARRAAQNINLHPETRLAVTAYAEGVNAWIASLTEQTLPVEFKLLGYRPEEWSVEKTAALFASFSFDLTFRNNDAAFSKAIAVLPEQTWKALYPIVPPYAQPIAPSAQMNADTLLPSRIAEPDTARILSDTVSTHSSCHCQPLFSPDLFFGSNNWAVSGQHTATGRPILCSDPHLSLNLPAIWYEVQLVCDSAGLNVYGVSAPSVPGVIIGFNPHIAWGLTNAESDVLDWYDVQLDEAHATYRYGNSVLPLERVVEEIKVRGKPSVIDTIYYTRFGPIPYRNHETPFDERVPKGKAMHWLAFEPNNELLTFLRLNRARTYTDYLEALSHYNVPAQNFVFASKSGDIAIWHNGNFPLRKPYQGAAILDATDSLTHLSERVPREALPHLHNPTCGFVSSANQQPSDTGYRYYLGWNYAPFERSMRINECLSEWIAKGQITPEQMMALQTDAVNLYARLILPPLLSALQAAPLSSVEQQCLDELRRWNFEHRPDLIAPTIFEAWATELSSAIWSDDLPEGSPRPLRNLTAWQIAGNPPLSFLDNTRTPQKETLQDIALTSFRAAVDSLIKRYGEFGALWKWQATRQTTIQHLARIEAFSRTLATHGNYNTVNATSQRSGPSWRMVVQLGDTVQAWGIYPGGQSGNPGSSLYDNAVIDWADGRYYSLYFLRTASFAQGIVARTALFPGHSSSWLSRVLQWFSAQWIIWWGVALLATLLFIERVKNGFIAGALLIGVIWAAAAVYFTSHASDLIAAKVATLLRLGSSLWLSVLTGLIGALVGAVGGATGSAMRALWLNTKPPAAPN